MDSGERGDQFQCEIRFRILLFRFRQGIAVCQKAFRFRVIQCAVCRETPDFRLFAGDFQRHIVLMAFPECQNQRDRAQEEKRNHVKHSPFVFHFGPWKGRNRWPLAHVENVCRTLFAAMVLEEAGGKGVTVLDSRRTTLHDYYRGLAAEHLPGRTVRELCLPVWTILPAAWLSSRLSCDTPLFDPTLYALETITHNLDFSNARMLEWQEKAGVARESA